jgi:ATP-dependent DNA helicase RecQ
MMGPFEAQIDAARRDLETTFGFDHFRPLQRDVLEAVFLGENVLAVMPTGSGKSMCFQLPALQGQGVTLIVSPLIALMQDQVLQLQRRGISAAALHSANTYEENASIEARLCAGRIKLLYLAPERLATPGMIALLQETKIDLLAVDEAHCVAEWGHDFRPDYLKLKASAQAIGAPQILALTASANARTRGEIAEKLFTRPPRIFVGTFDRPNLHLSVAHKINGLRQIEALIACHKGESGIIYCASRRAVERLAVRLAQNGHWTLPYHAKLAPEIRAAHQEEFLNGEGVIMVATVAFGMGIDKPNVRFVCHADPPQSIEAYHQEIGRAGRDGLPAETLALIGDTDIWLRERQIMQKMNRRRRKAEAGKFDHLLAYCETLRCRRQVLLEAFGEASKPCGHCDRCCARFRLFRFVFAGPLYLRRLLRKAGRQTRFILGDLLHRYGGMEVQDEAAFAPDLDADETQEWEDTGAATPDAIASLSHAEPAQALLTVTQRRILASLKAKRLELARAKKIKPAAILSEASALTIATLQPRDLDELTRAGLDSKELEFAVAFLAVVAAHERDG